MSSLPHITNMVSRPGQPTDKAESMLPQRDAPPRPYWLRDCGMVARLGNRQIRQKVCSYSAMHRPDLIGLGIGKKVLVVSLRSMSMALEKRSRECILWPM